MGTFANLWQNHRTLVVFVMILIIVIPFLIFYLNKAKKEHPKGLIAAALSNMGERFGYYIMNAVLVLFICSKFGLSDATSGLIFAVFYFLIYVLALPGGIIADRTQNYKRTIISGIIVMAIGYGLLSIPVFSDGAGMKSWPFALAMLALVLIACGNGLFKGNLQAIVGQLYDDFEAEAAKKGPEALAAAKEKRDSGFQIFYVFINIGGVIAPFVAPIIRDWYLKTKDLIYNADLPRLCHKFIMGTAEGNDMDNLTALSQNFTGASENLAGFCQNYLHVYNTGVHYSFIVSVIAMLISLFIFIAVKHKLPNPVKKEKAEVKEYSEAERQADAKEIKQRMAALYAVLGIAVFFWFSFHQNAQSLSIFARDFVDTSAIPPEILQFINPFFVIVLTPVVMWIFASLLRKGKEVSTPKKIALGMFIAACAYIFLIIIAVVHNYPSGDAFKALPEAEKMAMKTGPWVMIVTYFFLTVAELFISPLGLSFVSKIAPRHMVGMCQGLWLSATAVGNLLIFLGVKMLNTFPHQWMTWAVFALICLISMSIMLGMLKWLERVAK
ncbi:MAG: proton-dependent oligopeptide transporter, POT family [bacterium P201]|nr:MAG: proton-dependent oligopeptide transporter, POT family [bacterium P201]